jgi:hypothetical protein
LTIAVSAAVPFYGVKTDKPNHHLLIGREVALYIQLHRWAAKSLPKFKVPPSSGGSYLHSEEMLIFLQQMCLGLAKYFPMFRH